MNFVGGRKTCPEWHQRVVPASTEPRRRHPQGSPDTSNRATDCQWGTVTHEPRIGFGLKRSWRGCTCGWRTGCHTSPRAENVIRACGHPWTQASQHWGSRNPSLGVSVCKDPFTCASRKKHVGPLRDWGPVTFTRNKRNEPRSAVILAVNYLLWIIIFQNVFISSSRNEQNFICRPWMATT